MIRMRNILLAKTHGSELEVSMQGSDLVTMDRGQLGARQGVQMAMDRLKACD